jgi:hypothetical protein
MAARCPSDSRPDPDFAVAYTAYQPFADPDASVDMDEVEYEEWEVAQDAATRRLAEARAQTVGALALKLDAAMMSFETMAADTCMSDSEADLMRSCLRDAWAMAVNGLGWRGVFPDTDRIRHLAQDVRRTRAKVLKNRRRSRELCAEAARLCAQSAALRDRLRRLDICEPVADGRECPGA